MARIIDCSMIVSNKLWRSGWRVDISTRKEDPVEVEGIMVTPQSSTIHLSVHCATHVDSTLHRFEHGPTIDEVPIETFFGEAAVVDLTDKAELEPIRVYRPIGTTGEKALIPPDQWQNGW
jgi:kynurenine formamidase